MNKKKISRVLALIIVIIMIALIVATLLVAIFNGPANLLFSLLFCDIVIPVILYAYMVITKQIRRMRDQDENNG